MSEALPALLQVHTQHSHLFGASTIDELVERAKDGGIRALSMTSPDGVRVPFAFQAAGDAVKIKLLFGAPLKGRTFLAKNDEGYRNLCFLVSAHHLRNEDADLDALLKERGAGIVEPPPHAAGPVVGYHVPARRGLHRILRAVAAGRLLKGTPAEAEALPSAATLRRRLGRAGAREAWAIAESCTLRFEKPKRPIFPEAPLPPDDTPASRLFHLATEGIKRRYRPVPAEVMRRLLSEIAVIHELNFDAYFVIVHAIVEFCREAGIAVVGRGSAANSLVAYALGITNVDPLRHELLFERFLNRARMHDPPDIDLDLDWRRRDEVLDWVYETYGRERVAMICTFQTLQFRAAFREVAKVFGMAPPEVDRLSKLLPRSAPADLAAYPELRGRFLYDKEPHRTILRAARALCDYPRHLSIHSGGIVVADRPLTDYLPLQRSRKGLVVTQYDMHGVEKTGLVKIDLLGHRSLAVVADAARWTGADLAAIPETEPRAAALLKEGDTLGVFQLESPAMRGLLKMMAGASQDDAMIGLSLIRPGPAGSGMKDAYVRRRRGEETCDVPALARILPKTFGVMLSHDEILRAARDEGGLTLERADQLRRALSGMNDEDRVRAMAKEFVDGAAARGVGADEAARIWALVTNFVSYAYSKAHAATYARISYQALVLKARHPAAFFAAVLANGGGFYEARAYVEEARRRGARILLPDINRSEPSDTFEPPDAVRIGVGRVRDLTERTLDAILKRRPFVSLTDFLHRVPEAQRREAEHLVLTGCFDAFDGTRPEKLWRVLLQRKRSSAPRSAGRRGVAAAGAGVSRPEGVRRRESRRPGAGASRPDPDGAPAVVFRGARPRGGGRAHGGRGRDGGARGRGGGVDDHVPPHPHAQGRADEVRDARGTRRRCCTTTRADRWGVVEVNFFPDAYRRCGHVLLGYGPYLVRGRADDHLGAVTVTGRDAELLTL